MGPRNPVLNQFDNKEVLATLDNFLHYCKKKKISDEIITDINVNTLNYVKKCKRMKNSRNVMLTSRYLKENDLLAVPFDKGIGICIMSKETYRKKLKTIMDLPQFQKVMNLRKNAKNPILKEEERINAALKTLFDTGKLSKDVYNKLKPIGSQPPRLYGLAKVHKSDMPLRPVLSMPGSAYYRIAKEVTSWLSLLPECQIKLSTKSIVDLLKEAKLENGEILVIF